MNTVLRDSLRTSFAEFADKPLFSEERPFDKWTRYSEVSASSERLASVLCHFLADAAPPYTVCIYSRNRSAWVISDFACALAGITSVGLHTSWPKEEAAHVLNETSAVIVIASADQLPTVFSVASQCPKLKCIISMDGAESILPYSDRKDIQCISFDDIQKYSPEKLEDCIKISDNFFTRPEQNNPYATVIYSSGTTNSPKGLGVRKETWDADNRSGPFNTAEKIAVSCSPLAHGMDRGFVWQTVYCGGRVGFARSGDYTDLNEDIRLINPGVFVSMPNIWNRLYDEYKRRIRQLIADKLCEMLGVQSDESAFSKLGKVLDTFEAMATNVKPDELASKYPFVSEIRSAAMKEARGFLGKNISVIGTGGDFTSDEVMDFLRECYPGAMVVNSYGTTEVPGISSNGIINNSVVEVKLIDAPDAGCFTTDKPAPRGEIICRNKTKWMETKYWGDSEQVKKLSAEAFKDGWYHTGDVGSIDPNAGRLTILGRSRDVAEIYLGGRSVWIPLSKIEPVFRSCHGVRNIYIHSDRSQEYLIAVVSISENEMGGDPEKTRYDILCRLRNAGRAAGLLKHEIPKSVILTADSWTTQSGDLSATGKLRRGKLGIKYKTIIDAEYSRLEAVDEELAEFRKKINKDRGFDYLNYDFAARPHYHKQDGIRLAELYKKEREIISTIRVKGPIATSRLKAKEEEIKESIKSTKKSMVKDCENIGEKDKISALDKLMEMGRILRIKHKMLLDAQRESDPEVSELMKTFVDLGEKLKAAADEMGVDIPYQITAGIVLKPPAPPGSGCVNALPESEGLPSWRTDCACCGDLIEWGSAGAGTPRYKCMSCYNKDSHSAQSLCIECYNILKDLSLSEKAAAEKIRKGIVPCFALGHKFVEETLNTLWIREKIFVLDDHCLGTTLQRAFEWYSGRPCVGSLGNDFEWTSYKDIWQKACRLASGLKNAGVERGSVVCLVDNPENRAVLWPVCEFGCALAGCALCVVKKCDKILLPPNTAMCVVGPSDKKVALSYECKVVELSEILADQVCDSTCSAPDEIFAICANPQGEFVAFKTDDIWKRLFSSPEFNEPYVQVIMGSSVTMFDRLRLWDTVLNGGRIGIVDPEKCSVVSPTKVVLTLADPLIANFKLPQDNASHEVKSAYMKATFGGQISKITLDTSYTPNGGNEFIQDLGSLCKTLSVEFCTVRGFIETGYVTMNDTPISHKVSLVEGNLVNTPEMVTEYYMNDELTKKRFLNRSDKLYFVAPKEFI